MARAVDASLEGAAFGWVRAVNVAAKAGLLLLLLTAFLTPDYGHMRDKAALARAVAYPALALALPAWWAVAKKDRPFPWTADLLITVTCFSDILGNRLDLYDRLVWFDDWMHFVNTGMLAAAAVLLTLPAEASLAMTLERALAFGVTAAVAWEIAEYFAFLRMSSELPHAYADTLGDLGLGTLGAVCAAFAVHRARRVGSGERARFPTGT